MSADDFLPLFIYILAHAHLDQAEIEAEYMWGLLQPSILAGEVCMKEHSHYAFVFIPVCIILTCTHLCMHTYIHRYALSVSSCLFMYLFYFSTYSIIFLRFFHFFHPSFHFYSTKVGYYLTTLSSAVQVLKTYGQDTSERPLVVEDLHRMLGEAMMYIQVICDLLLAQLVFDIFYIFFFSPFI